MQFIDDVPSAHDLTYDDVSMVPRPSAVASRYDVDLATVDGRRHAADVVADMTAIAGKRMAETVARRGGLVVIPQDIPAPVVAQVVRYVKSRHLVFDTPIELAPDQTVAEALSLIPKRAHRAAVVVADGKPVGVVSAADCAEVDRFAQVGQIMSPAAVTIAADTEPRDAFDALDRAKARWRWLSMPTARWSVCSPAPAPSAQRSTNRRWMHGRTADRRRGRRQRRRGGQGGELLEAGVDCLVVDTAHGHQERMLEALRAVRALSPRSRSSPATSSPPRAPAR